MGAIGPQSDAEIGGVDFHVNYHGGVHIFTGRLSEPYSSITLLITAIAHQYPLYVNAVPEWLETPDTGLENKG